MRQSLWISLACLGASVLAGCPSMCLAEGEGIRTPAGVVAIDVLRPGARVCSIDSEGRPAISWVTATERHFAQRHLTVAVASAAGSQALRLTPEHPVLVGREWLPAGRLRAGACLGGGTELQVTGVTAASGAAPVYSIAVEPWRNFVHASGAVLHNKTRPAYPAEAPDLGTLIGLDGETGELLLLYANGETPTRFDRFVESEGWRTEAFVSWTMHGRSDYYVGAKALPEGEPEWKTERCSFPDLLGRNRFIWTMVGRNRARPSRLILLRAYRERPRLLSLDKDDRQAFAETVERLDAFFAAHSEAEVPDSD